MFASIPPKCSPNFSPNSTHVPTGGGGRVAIVDIDYHHGNGTQQIFWERPDVFYGSLHADPNMEFPYFSGQASERGDGAGAGATLNVPLAIDPTKKGRGQGVDEGHYLAALRVLTAAVGVFEPDYLVVSMGLDTFEGDIIGGFGLQVRYA
jgi:acetoin utilization deacetylase AcuC-like enzyme